MTLATGAGGAFLTTGFFTTGLAVAAVDASACGIVFLLQLKINKEKAITKNPAYFTAIFLIRLLVYFLNSYSQSFILSVVLWLSCILFTLPALV